MSDRDLRDLQRLHVALLLASMNDDQAGADVLLEDVPLRQMRQLARMLLAETAAFLVLLDVSGGDDERGRLRAAALDMAAD